MGVKKEEEEEDEEEEGLNKEAPICQGKLVTVNGGKDR